MRLVSQVPRPLQAADCRGDCVLVRHRSRQTQPEDFAQDLYRNKILAT